MNKKIIVVVLIVLMILLLIPTRVLVAEDFNHNKHLKAWKVGDRFTVSYIHSVELTEVLEIYHIEDKDIILKETYFKSYGAGLPATTKYDFEITTEGFRIFNIDEKIERLIYRTGARRANHKLLIEDKKYDFLAFSQGQTPVHLQVVNMSLLEYFIKEAIK